MKIKKSELKQLIKEEIKTTMDEGFLDKVLKYPISSLVQESLTPGNPGRDFFIFQNFSWIYLTPEKFSQIFIRI